MLYIHSDTQLQMESVQIVPPIINVSAELRDLQKYIIPGESFGHLNQRILYDKGAIERYNERKLFHNLSAGIYNLNLFSLFNLFSLLSLLSQYF